MCPLPSEMEHMYVDPSSLNKRTDVLHAAGFPPPGCDTGASSHAGVDGTLKSKFGPVYESGWSGDLARAAGARSSAAPGTLFA